MTKKQEQKEFIQELRNLMKFERERSRADWEDPAGDLFGSTYATIDHEGYTILTKALPEINESTNIYLSFEELKHLYQLARKKKRKLF